MRLLAIGRLRDGPEAELYRRYDARLRPGLAVRELPEAAGGDARRREATSILGALPAGAHAVVLDLGGRMLSSEAFAATLAAWRDAGREPWFVIGGAEGLDRSVIDRADDGLSFGAMTWPHMLVRAMLAEQLYRAQAIDARHPYHKARRP